MNIPDKFWSNFWETEENMWIFYGEIVWTWEINFWETASVKE